MIVESRASATALSRDNWLSCSIFIMIIVTSIFVIVVNIFVTVTIIFVTMIIIFITWS